MLTNHLTHGLQQAKADLVPAQKDLDAENNILQQSVLDQLEDAAVEVSCARAEL